MTVRAKFRCVAENHRRWGAHQDNANRVYEFQAMYDPNLPEDQRYAKATPTGKLEITVDNPAVAFTPGKSYYLDFTEAD